MFPNETVLQSTSMKHFATLAVILFSVGYVHAIAINYAVGEYCPVNGEQSCSDDCEKVLVCNAHVTVVETKCSVIPARWCNPISHECTDTTSSCSYTFECNGIGLFPDPFDCTKYHFCPNDKGNSTVAKCLTPSAYDPLSTECTKTMEDRVCVEKPIPTCTKSGQKGAQEENPNIYYRCINKKPVLFKCNTGEIYDNSSCVNPVATTTTVTTTSMSSTTTPTTITPTTTTITTATPTTTTPTTTLTTTTPRTTTTATTTTTRFPCPEEGGFLDSTDPSCKSFFVCVVIDGALTSYNRTCLTGYHYDTNLQKCVTPEGCSNVVIL